MRVSAALLWAVCYRLGLAAILFGVRPTLWLPFCLCAGFNVPDTCGRRAPMQARWPCLENRDAYPHRRRDL